ncbi:hypothetical protein [Gudongella sp. SC589]|jgi:hypothetical protein|uniref:hypothetical protein n=1 Tax=Gudongella sp. SC589 TaxID=3385990 RepID=UPI003904C08C
MKFMDKIRDVLYDSVDYIFMIVIVLVVIGVIGWRLDVLFAKDALGSQQPGQVIVDNSGREEYDPDQPSDEPEVIVEGEEGSEDQVAQDGEPQEEPGQPAQPSITIVQVEIPVGSMPGKIGLILEEKGVVTSSREFIAKAVELGLDTKLKSGTYKIQLGLPTEEIVRLLTN